MATTRRRRFRRIAAILAVLAFLAVPSASAQDEVETAPVGGGADQTVNDDLLVNGVQGGTCTSDNNTCVNGETFLNTSSTLNAELKLKSGVPGLWLNDTTNANSDWSIRGGGPLDFVDHAGQIVMQLNQNADPNSLVVDFSGVNVRNLNFNNGFGLIDTGGGNGEFLITGPQPNTIARISRNAPTGSFVVGQQGVGVRNLNPIFPLHVKSASNSGAVVAENTLGGAPTLRTLFALQNNGPPSFTFIDTSPNGVDWLFRSSFNGAFAMDAVQTVTSTELALFPGGNLVIGGSLTQGSSSDIKHDISAADPAAVLDGVRSLDLSTWSYDSEPGVTHIGPMSEEFYETFGLGASSTGIAAVDADGVALTAIQALAAENAELEARIAALEAQLAG